MIHSKKLLPAMAAAVLILIYFTACGGGPNLLKEEGIGFRQERYLEEEKYIGTFSGRVENSKGKRIEGLVINADMSDYPNISSRPGKTDETGFFTAEIFWEAQPYLLADIFPDPLETAFTPNGYSYIKEARTITVDVPVIMGDSKEPILQKTITMYSLAFVIKRISDEVVKRRVIDVKFSAEDFNTGLPIIGAKFTLIPVGTVPTPDSLLSIYIARESLRKFGTAESPEYVTSEVEKILNTSSPVEFSVLTFQTYILRVEHPLYHTVDVEYYMEKPIDKIVRVSQKSDNRTVDIIDR